MSSVVQHGLLGHPDNSMGTAALTGVLSLKGSGCQVRSGPPAAKLLYLEGSRYPLGSG